MESSGGHQDRQGLQHMKDKEEVGKLLTIIRGDDDGSLLLSSATCLEDTQRRETESAYNGTRSNLHKLQFIK